MNIKEIEELNKKCFGKYGLIPRPYQILFYKHYCGIEYANGYVKITYKKASDIVKCWEIWLKDWLMFKKENDVKVTNTDIEFYYLHEDGGESIPYSEELANIKFDRIIFPYFYYTQADTILYTEEESEAVKKLKAQKIDEWIHRVELFYKYRRFNPVLYWERKVKFTDSGNVGILTQRWYEPVTTKTLLNILRFHDIWDVVDHSQKRDGCIEWIKKEVDMI